MKHKMKTYLIFKSFFEYITENTIEILYVRMGNYTTKTPTRELKI